MQVEYKLESTLKVDGVEVTKAVLTVDGNAISLIEMVGKLMAAMAPSPAPAAAPLPHEQAEPGNSQ